MTGVACRSRDRMHILRFVGRGHTQRHIFACLPISVDGASLGVSRPLELPIDMQPVSTLIYMCFLSIMLEWGSALPQLRFLCAVSASAYHLLHHARALRLLVVWSQHHRLYRDVIAVFYKMN